MYKFLRNTHLLLGVAVFLFVLMYGVSAVQMAHDKWFSMKRTVSELRVTVPTSVTDDPRAIADALRSDGVRGEIRDVQLVAGGYTISIERPGAASQIHYIRATREARVRINTTGFIGMLNRIHHLGGFWHGYWPVDLWGIFVALVSLTLLVLGATGIYLWFKIRKERAIGLVLLTVNLAICIGLLVMIRTA